MFRVTLIKIDGPARAALPRVRSPRRSLRVATPTIADCEILPGGVGSRAHRREGAAAMSGVRRGARAVLRWFAPLYVTLIIVQVFLAGEGVFRLRNVYDSDTCKQTAAHCGGSNTLDPHRFLGFVLTEPLALLFVITALLAWHPDTRVRVVSIVAPILTFVQLILAVIGKWVGGYTCSTRS